MQGLKAKYEQWWGEKKRGEYVCARARIPHSNDGARRIREKQLLCVWSKRREKKTVMMRMG